MTRIEKTVFISYRRTNFPWAYCIYQDLTHHGYDVFFDYQSIDSGNFEKVILENIKARAHFIIVLSPSALEGCDQPGDWLRREIETAINEKRNIIPVMLEGFDFGSPLVKKVLTGKLSSLSSINGMSLVAEYVEAGFEKLRNRFLNVTIEDIHLYTLPEDAKEITENQQAAANEAPLIEKKELTAQEWFERGYNYYQSGNIKEAIRCHTETIRLSPNYAFAYFSRGFMWDIKGDREKALVDYNKAIQLQTDISDLASYHSFRGDTYINLGEFEKAISDYNKALDLDSKDDFLYLARGRAHYMKNDLDHALKDFDIAISLNPDDAFHYYNRALIWKKKKDYSKAITDYQKYLELGGGESDDGIEEANKEIKRLKSKLVKKKSTRKKTSK